MEEPQAIGQKAGKLFRKILLINDDKSWLREIKEWIIGVLVVSGILCLLALFEINKAHPWEDNVEDLISKYHEELIIFFIICKCIYNYLGASKDTLVELLSQNIKQIKEKVDENERLRHIRSESDIAQINSKVDSNTTLIDKYLQGTKIVFESGIKKYSHIHLLALQRMLNSLDRIESVNKLCAIDNSDPITWWSETMTGYLALLAKWKSRDTDNNRRTVSRIFVYNNNELLSPILAKTLTLHSLIGFRTYIYSKKMFDNIFKEIAKGNEHWVIEKKEVLLWNNPTVNKIDFELSEKLWQNVRCYQSFWNLDSDKNDRYRNIEDNSFVWQNYYKDSIKTSEIKVWFEFICCENRMNANGSDKKKKEYYDAIPLQYEELIKRLEDNENAPVCKNFNEVRHIDKENFGIEIKTVAESDFDKFDFSSEDDIKAILSEYYLKNTRQKA